MTQYSLPQDGNTGDGGTYSADIAKKEIHIPYHFTDNPRRVGLHSLDVVLNAEVLSGTFLAGEGRTTDHAFISNEDIPFSLPSPLGARWAVLLIDTTWDGQIATYCDTSNLSLLCDNNGVATPVPANSIELRFADLSTVTDTYDLLRGSYIIQHLLNGLDTPKRFNSTYGHVFDNKPTINTKLYSYVRPNTMILTGTVGVPNLANGEIYDACIDIHVNNPSGIPIETNFKYANNPVTPAFDVNYFTVPLWLLASSNSQPVVSHCVFRISLYTFNNYLIVGGFVILHSLPIGNKGVPSINRTANSRQILTGVVDLNNTPDWKISNILVVSHGDVGEACGANSALEVTFQ